MADTPGRLDAPPSCYAEQQAAARCCCSPIIESMTRNVVLPIKPAFLRVQDDSMEESLGKQYQD